jgi:hypothetical protein
MENEEDFEDLYLAKYIKRLEEAKTLKEKQDIIDKIYTDGYEDGVDSCED